MMYKCIDCSIIYSLSGTQALKEASAYSINEFLGRGDASSLKVPWSPYRLPLARCSAKPHINWMYMHCERAWKGEGGWRGDGHVTCRVCSTMFMPEMWPSCQVAFLWAHWWMWVGIPCSEHPLVRGKHSGLVRGQRQIQGSESCRLDPCHIAELPGGMQGWSLFLQWNTLSRMQSKNFC